MKVCWALVAALAGLTPSCDRHAASAADDASDPAVLTTREGLYRIEWSSEPNPIPLNSDFELLARVLDSDGTSVSSAELYVDATMPDHGHGMVRQPRVEPSGGGRFSVRGMLFHMPGRWQLRFEAIVEDVGDVAVVDLEL